MNVKWVELRALRQTHVESWRLASGGKKQRPPA